MGLPTPATSVHAQLNHGNVMAASSILIVDDEPGIRELLAMILEAAGHSVAAAKDGVEAVKIIAMSGGGHIARESYLRIARNFGAHYLLEKPFSQSGVLDAIEKVQAMP